VYSTSESFLSKVTFEIVLQGNRGIGPIRQYSIVAAKAFSYGGRELWRAVCQSFYTKAGIHWLKNPLKRDLTWSATLFRPPGTVVPEGLMFYS